MKVAVFTRTRDRLEYTQRSFQSLQEKAGHPYDHFVVDNGSEDGTPAWLMQHEKDYAGLVLNKENKGIDGGLLQAMEMIQKQGPYDLTVSFDNDCEVVTDDVLARIVAVYESLGEPDEWIMSPRVTGIVHPPTEVGTELVAGELVARVSNVGGLFMVVPWNVRIAYKVPAGRSPGEGSDVMMCLGHCDRGGKCGYLRDVVVHHCDTTPGQIKKYPEYWARKQRENGWA